MAKQQHLLDDREAALVGHITLLKEEVLSQREALGVANKQITDLGNRVRFLEERLAELTRPRTLLTEKEAAEMLRVHIQSLKRWRNEKPARVPFVLFEGGDVRYRAEDIERYLQSRERGARSALRAA
jgi:chromosome segregation ATPase